MAIHKSLYSSRSEEWPTPQLLFDTLNTEFGFKVATRAGIYRCSGCGREITSEQSKPLPSHDHHEHTERQGAIRWMLIVYADHRSK